MVAIMLQPTTYRDRSQARGRLSIFHITLLGELGYDEGCNGAQ